MGLVKRMTEAQIKPRIWQSNVDEKRRDYSSTGINKECT